MKPISVLAAVACIAVLSTVACKKNEPVTSETNTTGAQVQAEQPATEPVAPPPVQPQINDTTTGTSTDTTTTTQSGMRSTTMEKGKDAGLAADFPSGGSDLIDRDHKSFGQQQPVQPVQPSGANAKDPTNHSTPLGDGKSGTSTDNVGTYGGKATWGTGTPNKGTKMDKPAK